LNPLEQVVLAIQSLAYAFRQILQVPLWVPWLALGALQLAVIGGLWWFAHPTISWLLAPAVRAMAGEDALHYPNLFRWLPELYGRFDLVVGALAGAVVTGQSTALFAAWFSGQPLRPGEGMRRGVSRAGALILANLPLTLLVLGLSSVFNGWLEHRQGPALLIRVAPLVTLGMAVILQAFFLWVNPLLMLGGRSLVGALTALPRAATRGVWTALTLAVAATVPLLPIQMLARGSDQIVARGSPELVGWLVIAQALIALATGFVLTGGATLAYQSLVGPALEDDA